MLYDLSGSIPQSVADLTAPGLQVEIPAQLGD